VNELEVLLNQARIEKNVRALALVGLLPERSDERRRARLMYEAGTDPSPAVGEYIKRLEGLIAQPRATS